MLPRSHIRVKEKNDYGVSLKCYIIYNNLDFVVVYLYRELILLLLLLLLILILLNVYANTI